MREFAARAGARVLLLASALLLAAAPASAKILKTRRPHQYKELTLTVGSGVEYESDGESTELGLPFLLEYGFTKMLKVSVEPSYVRVRDGTTTSGPGDLETTVTWEFPTERRYRPGLALEEVSKWPTAHAGLGTGRADHSLGVIVSKEFVAVDFDLNGVYTWIGSPPGVSLRNTFEASLAAEWHLTTVLDVEAEAVTSFGAGGHFSAQPGSIGGFANLGGAAQGESESEGTLGLAEKLTKRLKLEQGVVLKSGGSWQAVAAWEWDFGEGR